MKTLCAVVFILISFTSLSQERLEINGKITAPVGESPAGISVINQTAKRATISNDQGLFQIRVKVGDTLEFSALQFQNFSVLIDDGVIENRRLNVFISEAVTELPEVVVTPYDLSGNVEVDVKIIPVVETNLPTKSAAEINSYNYTFRPDSLVSPANAAMRESMIANGANFANIFRNIYKSRNVVANIENDDIDEQVLELYNDQFFLDQLNIERGNIHEFIYFAEDNGLSENMLKPENEMDLIEFLIAQSEQYRQRKAVDN